MVDADNMRWVPAGRELTYHEKNRSGIVRYPGASLGKYTNQ